MNKIEAIIRPEKLIDVKDALASIGIVGMNSENVTGRGRQKGVVVREGRGAQPVTIDMLPKVRVNVVVGDADTDRVCQTIIEAARTGEIGDGKVFVIPVSQVIRVRTGEQGEDAI